ncbi:MAG TPA: hypothetical protein VHJ78_07480 [Actinomycetota bacterium]|nr:hypothetical protein [Actinomycetota bacterium]
MGDQEEQGQESEAPASTDSDTVQAALKGIPGLADAVENRPARQPAGDEQEEGGEPDSQYRSSRAEVEDSETVQQALKQLGLQ